MIYKSAPKYYIVQRMPQHTKCAQVIQYKKINHTMCHIIIITVQQSQPTQAIHKQTNLGAFPLRQQIKVANNSISTSSVSN